MSRFLDLEMADASVRAALKGDSSLLRVKRENGESRTSVRDFRSVRATWVRLTLTAGVPLELVQKVMGHKANRRRAQALLSAGVWGLSSDHAVHHAEAADFTKGPRDCGPCGQRAEARGQGAEGRRRRYAS